MSAQPPEPAGAHHGSPRDRANGPPRERPTDTRLRISTHQNDRRHDSHPIARELQISEDTGHAKTNTNGHLDMGFGESRRSNEPKGTSGYVLLLEGPVNAGRSLYQSKPSIEAAKPTTAPGRYNPKTPAAVGVQVTDKLEPIACVRPSPAGFRRAAIGIQRAPAQAAGALADATLGGQDTGRV